VKGGLPYHDKQICQTLARTVSVAESSNRTMLWASATTQATIAAHRHNSGGMKAASSPEAGDGSMPCRKPL
jgi:hypothetical protein